MDEITIGDKKYVSSKQAAKITGYAKDYVGQLCREGRVEARLVGRNWYVLESAIREHRFGSGKEASEEVKGEPSKPSVEAISTWEQPQYKAETPTFVPPLAPKPPTPVESAAIVDMQSAWKEWFEEKKPQFEALPDGSEDFKDEYLPVIVPKAPVEESVVEPVTISRVETPPQLPKEEPEEEIALHRSYASLATGEQIPETTVPVMDLTQKRPVRREMPAQRPRNKQGSSGALRATLLVVAVSVGIVAIVGTGNADRLFAGTSLDFGIQKNIVDFLGGKSTYESSL